MLKTLLKKTGAAVLLTTFSFNIFGQNFSASTQIDTNLLTSGTFSTSEKIQSLTQTSTTNNWSSPVQNKTTANSEGLINENFYSAERNAMVLNPTVVPTPQMAMSTPDYPVTAGDIYLLAYAAGSTPVTYKISVDTTYRIRISNLAVINAKGLTFVELKKQVEDIVSKNYPLSGVQFILEVPSVFTVTLKGEVKDTTTIKAWGLTRLSSVIFPYFTDYSSDRNITITSMDGTVNQYDVFKAIRFGDLKEDPYLRPGDTVTVQRSERKVMITGGVERPGIYDLLPGDNLKNLINIYGGGLSPDADTSRIELKRRQNTEFKSGETLYLNGDSIAEDFELLNYDMVEIGEISQLKPVMFIEGAINTSVGTTPETSEKFSVEFTQGENYGFLIRRVKDLFSNTSDLKQAYIIREDRMIPIDASLCLYDSDYYTTEIVQPNDTLMIPFIQSFVTVAGAVNKPGRYPYIPGRDWEYYVGLAGGFQSGVNAFESVKITDLNGNKLKKTDEITPETTITASTNSFTYYWGKYAPVVTTVLSAVSTIFTIMAVTK